MGTGEYVNCNFSKCSKKWQKVENYNIQLE
uniref:Uncharacterized protein n=1 Tax=Rhizophora mucronata TaxID=61149 RepID=A0A2P2JTL9_RHIMU